MKKPISSINAFVLALVAGSVLAGSALAGPLSPPPGPIASTAKPLAEIEPRIAINAANTPGDSDSLFRITQPGSYYLTANITGASGKAAIEIAASNVTLDLSGFALTGVPGALSGISCDGVRRGVVIRNGAISSWPDRGIDFDGASNVTGARIERLTVSACAITGLEIGPASVVDSCMLLDCESAIYVGKGSVVRGCTVSGASTQGIGMDNESIVEDCTVRALSSAVCIAFLGDGSTVRNCSTSGGLTGVSCDADGILENCRITGASQAAIAGASRCRIVGNTISDCKGQGIWIRGSYCLIAGNTIRAVRGTGGNAAGLFSNSGEERNSIRNNSVADCDIGIRLQSGGNAVFANELTSNTKHFDVAVNNRVGPLATGPLSPAINTNTGGNGMGTTDPNANILY
ncbi:MAG: right-handed parallel beta-helix repeat-containing protein [Phycisphaeraceae bacterium]|nr:right-handed parallel beta-helix repeat-containing protein [Phycisphaeraceae bacterium]